MLKRLFTEEINDRYARENFRRLNDFASEEALLKPGFKFFDIDIAEAGYPATITFLHRLGYQPKDVILTSSIGAGSATFNYSDFTSETISITATGDVKLRFFLGTYSEGNIR